MDDECPLPIGGLADLAHPALIGLLTQADDFPIPVRRFDLFRRGFLFLRRCHARESRQDQSCSRGDEALPDSAIQRLDPILLGPVIVARSHAKGRL